MDAKKGDDKNPGSKARPWRSLAHALEARIQAGDTLYLRGGVYREHVVVKAKGTAEKPVTIRGYPGEFVVIDGGLREFFEKPAEAWEPCPGGADGEFRSAKTYPNLGGREGATNLLGSFSDSMVPLHGYRFITDLRSGNEYFANLNDGKTEAGEGVYCGPGVFYDVKAGRIHVRLAHTRQLALGKDNYRGETDPRKLRLVISAANAGPPLSIEDARYVRVQDLVVRGARTATVSVSNSHNIEFDGVTSYGGASAMSVRDSGGLRLWNCALRGIAAPWTYRGSLKYRAIEARIFSASGWSPTGADNHDFELAYSEFTDCVDGVFIGNVRKVRFHHNLLDNVSDDGMFLTARTAYDGATPGGNVHIYQNRLSRCLTVFAFGVGHGRQKMTPTGRQTGDGVFIYRNLFDFRRPVMYTQPGEGEAKITSYGRVGGDHGGPLWEPMTIYHNTFLHVGPPWRGYYLSGLGSHMAGGSMRRLFNNLTVQASGRPGAVLPPVVPPGAKADSVSKKKPAKPADPLADLLDQATKKKPKPKVDGLDTPELSKLKKKLAKELKPRAPLPVDFQADGNLHWSDAEKPTAQALFARFRGSPAYEASKAIYRPGWTTHDVVANPRLAAFDANWPAVIDARPQSDSPAIDAGVSVPDDWADPLRRADRSKPDIGAIPLGARPWAVGVRGRWTVFGELVEGEPRGTAAPAGFLLDENQLPKPRNPATGRAAIVQGYPAFDAPLLAFALRSSRVPFDKMERTWLKPDEYGKYQLVIVVGDLPRAKIEPNRYDEKDLEHVGRFLRDGGTLMLMRGNTSLFGTPSGKEFLERLTGGGRAKPSQYRILLPKHPWVRHLDTKRAAEWINARHVQPIRAAKGQIILGDRAGLASLYHLKVGKGQLIYVGWDLAASLPHGRKTSTVEQEARYEEQMQVLMNVVQSLTVTLKE